MRILIIFFLWLCVLGGPFVYPSDGDLSARPEIIPAPGKVTFVSDGFSGKNIMGYWINLPEKHHPSQTWPILIFLHGGGMGENPDISRVKRYGPLKQVLEGSLTDQSAGTLLKGFIIVCPILPENPKNFTLWIDNIKILDSIIDTIIIDYRGDPSRLYITGSSRGGSGAWRFPKHSRYPIAAIVPVCGFYIKKANLDSLVDIPVWITCNTGDRVYNTQRRAVFYIEEKGGERFLLLDTASPDDSIFLEKKHIFTSFAKKGHDAWTATYASPRIYQWMLNFRNINGKITMTEKEKTEK